MARFVIRYKDMTYCGEHRKDDGELHAIWVYNKWCKGPMFWTTKHGAERYLKNRILKIRGEHKTFALTEIRIDSLSEGECSV